MTIYRLKKIKSLPTIFLLMVSFLSVCIPSYAQTNVIDQSNDLFLEIGQDHSLSNPPENLFISNVSTTSFTINWITKQPAVGAVIFGYSPDEITKMSLDKRDTKDIQKPRYTHIVDIVDTSLSSTKSIYFQLIINEEKVSPNQDPSFVFTPPATLASPPSPTSQDGTLLPNYEIPQNSDDFIIACRINNDSLWASTTINPETRNFNIALGSILTSDLTSYALATDSYINFFVWGAYNAQSRQDILLSEEPITISIEKPLEDSSPPVQDPLAPDIPIDLIEENLADMNILPRTSLEIDSKFFRAIAFISFGFSIILFFKLSKIYFYLSQLDIRIFNITGNKKDKRLLKKILQNHRYSFEKKF